MHLPNNIPAPCHCVRFDTTLLEQIVAVEVDTAVHCLKREKGITIDSDTQECWTKTVLQHVEDQTFNNISSRSFLPGVLQKRMADEISCILHNNNIVDTPQSLPVTHIFPVRRLCFYKPVLSAVRFLFEKRT